MAALVPSLLPGVADRHVAHVLQPRWSRARSLLLAGLIACPVLFALSCVLLVGTAVSAGLVWWLVLPLLGSGIPAVVVALRLHRLILEPHRWLPSAFLVCGVQLLLGGIPATGMAFGAVSGTASAVVTGTFVTQWIVLALSCVFAYRASRTLLLPVCPELGSTSFTVAFRARLPITGDGLLSGSTRIRGDRVEWSARRHRGRGGPTAEGHVTFDRIHSVRASVLPPSAQRIPWLRLSDGSTMYTSPGPVVLVGTDAGEWMFPIPDAGLFIEVLTRRITTWRGACAR